jgi:GGDEF domain-containing protein
MGGDEFLVFVPNTNTQELESMHNFINEEVKKRCDENCPLTLSFGHEVLYQFDDNLFHGVKTADERMYEHKRQCKSIQNK